MRNSIFIYVLMMSLVFIAPAVQAGGRTKVAKEAAEAASEVVEEAVDEIDVSWFRKLFGMGKSRAKNATDDMGFTEADDLAIDVTEAGGRQLGNAYDEAAKRGDILPPAEGYADSDDMAKTGIGLFRNLRSGGLRRGETSHTFVRTVGQADAIKRVRAGIDNPGKEGFVIYGNPGAGRKQVVSAIEEDFRRSEREALKIAAENPQEAIDIPRNYIVKIDIDSHKFKDLDEFKAQLDLLQDGSTSFREANTVVFLIEDASELVRSGSDRPDVVLDQYMSILRKYENETPQRKIKLGVLATPGEEDNIIKNSRVGREGLVRATVKETDDNLELFEILKLNKALIDPEDQVNLRDEDLKALIRWVKKYSPGDGKTEKAINILQQAVSEHKLVLKNPNVPIEDKVAEALKRDRAVLKRRLREAEEGTGAYDEELRDTLPVEIAKLNEKIFEAEEDVRRLTGIREELKKLAEVDTSKLSPEELKEHKVAVHYLEENQKVVSSRQMAIELAEVTGRPISEILEFTGRMSLEQFKKRLDEEVIGQPAYKKAILSMAESIIAVMTSNKPLRENRAIRTMLVWGPPGTGKTSGGDLLKELMDGHLFMAGAEFKTAQAAEKLIGAPPGYVGYDRGGIMTNFAMQVERGFYIFDDADKAAPEVFDTFAAAWIPAILNDSRGIKTTYNKSGFYVSGNWGWDALLEDMAAGKVVDPYNLTKEQAIDYIRRTYPDMPSHAWSRIDEIVFVGYLETDEELLQLLDIFVKRLYKNPNGFMWENRLKVELTDAAKDKMLKAARESMGDPRRMEESLSSKVEIPLQEIFHKAQENLTDAIEKALDNGQYYNSSNGKIMPLMTRKGDKIIVDVAEDGNFAFSIAKPMGDAAY